MSIVGRHIHIKDVKEFLDAVEATLKRQLTVDEWERAREAHAAHHFKEVTKTKRS